ncbi:hypothetical protein ABZV24_13085 [Streptomyces sp. NPDC005251]|uniref:hypothetical protein n=1 Tax=Streptomyces sp. NPDC005251 TaxID=3157166 RepID=UPI0033A0765A
MTKLPDNQGLLKLYHDGFSDIQIAEMYDVTYQAVNLRLGAMGVRRAPFRAQVASILESAWPTEETGRGAYVEKGRHRDLCSFLRLRLGDPGMTSRQRDAAQRFERALKKGDCVMDFRPGMGEPFPYVPRVESDGRMVIRWPEGRKLPDGELRAALHLPEA